MSTAPTPGDGVEPALGLAHPDLLPTTPSAGPRLSPSFSPLSNTLRPVRPGRVTKHLPSGTCPVTQFPCPPWVRGTEAHCVWAQEYRDEPDRPHHEASQADRGHPQSPSSTPLWQQPAPSWSPVLGTAWESELKWGPQPLGILKKTQLAFPQLIPCPAQSWHMTGLTSLS